MDSKDELSQLEELLCADLEATNDIDVNDQTLLREVDIFKPNKSSNDNEETATDKLKKVSVVHNGDTDSSDDEERRNYSERKYDSYGSQVKKVLDNQDKEQKDKKLDFETRLRQTNIDIKVEKKRCFINKPQATQCEQNNKYLNGAYDAKTNDIYTDPIFGIRITKPLISSTGLLDRMQGKEAINLLRVKRHVENEDVTRDWVIAGVIVRKSVTKKSQKGNQFIIWTLSDLKDDLKTVSMFLFRKAYINLWKTTEGTVVAILNPNILDRSQNSADQACLSVDNPDNIMVLGQSKDFGLCKSKKKDGQPCTAFVNINQCEHCVYHVKQEYQKYSRRQELQSSTMGKGLVTLQNKVLGKNTVIYGGKAYSALPSCNSKKIKDKDQNRLMSLSDYYKTEGDKLMMNRSPHGTGPLKNNIDILHSPTTQRKSDSDMLNKLSSSPATTSPKINKPLSQEATLAEKVAHSSLGKGFGLKGSGTIDLNMSYSQRAIERTKANAVRLIQQSGGLKKVDPNNTKGTETGKKRALAKLNNSVDENDSKRSRIEEENTKKPKTVMTERFKKILEATSAHQNLLKEHDDDEQEKYFNKLEKKEAMEEKMLNTFKLACKAVRCVQCKYTAFSASQKCKEERHPLKVLDSFKRFFKCGNCGNRTVSLEIIPLHSCRNCNSSKWEKAPMMKEKVTTLTDGLSIRGEEESYIGGQVTCGKNINLLVPDNSGNE